MLHRNSFIKFYLINCFNINKCLLDEIRTEDNRINIFNKSIFNKSKKNRKITKIKPKKKEKSLNASNRYSHSKVTPLTIIK